MSTLVATILLVVLVVLIVVVIARSVRIIPQATAGIVERFGRYHRTLHAGLNVITPFIDQLRPLIDLREQLEQVRKLGGLSAVMDKLPTQLAGRAAMPSDQADRELKRQIAIIDSMTRQERLHSGLLDGPRRRRIAAGAGVQVQDVNRLLKQFMEMQKLMKGMKGGKLGRMMAGLRGAMPPRPPGRR